jgi:hypothetical protein
MGHTIREATQSRQISKVNAMIMMLASASALALASTAGCTGATEPTEEQGEASESGLGETTQLAGIPVVCVSIQRTAGMKAFDVTLSAEKPNTNYGSGSFALSGASASGDPGKFRALFRFDTASIPANSKVVSAKLVLSQVNNGPGSADMHLVTAPWSEGTVTWNSFGGAFVPAPFKTFSTAPSPLNIDLLAEVQAWVSQTAPNHGIMIEQDTSTFQTKYRSQEYQVPAQRPRLDVCYQIACPAGVGDCNGDPADGCETALDTPSNCGACGLACALPHASASCDGGACTLGACDPGYGDCDGNPQNGCEASLALVPNSANCGACGVSCPECAGFLGLACPQGLICHDYEGDNCFPNGFGADCVGICLAPLPSELNCPTYCNGISGAVCPQGLFCTEVPLGPGVDAPSLCVAPEPCQGIGQLNCQEWTMMCMDDPTDSCDGNVDPSCPGRCMSWWTPESIPTYCGGTNGLGCPQGLTCQDVPCDGCDAEYGGINCLGTCVPSPSPSQTCPYDCNGLAGATCPEGLFCEEQTYVAGCQNDCPSHCTPPTPCSGIGTQSCSSWALICEDDPTDSCDASINPLCPGRCVPWTFFGFDPAPDFCGGTDNVACPGTMICQDVPCDGCDPQNGGNDCIGTCVAPPPPPPEQCDFSCMNPSGVGPECPHGYYCADDPNGLCGVVGCDGICIAPMPCVGIGSLSCPTWLMLCEDDPTDACDGSADPNCPGRCVPLVAGAFDQPELQLCGGLMGLGCPAGMSCHDIACDGCNPANGDANCTGTCGP